MPRARRSPLFSAIVLAGASLTVACGKEATSVVTGTDAGTDAAKGSAAPSAGGDAETCPPGSERPVPPCYHIR